MYSSKKECRNGFSLLIKKQNACCFKFYLKTFYICNIIWSVRSTNLFMFNKFNILFRCSIANHFVKSFGLGVYFWEMKTCLIFPVNVMSNYIKYVKFLLVWWFILKFLFIWVRVGVYKLGFKHILVLIIERWLWDSVWFCRPLSYASCWSWGMQSRSPVNNIAFDSLVNMKCYVLI